MKEGAIIRNIEDQVARIISGKNLFHFSITFNDESVSRGILTTYLTVLYCFYSRKFPAVFVLMILKFDTVSQMKRDRLR